MAAGSTASAKMKGLLKRCVVVAVMSSIPVFAMQKHYQSYSNYNNNTGITGRSFGIFSDSGFSERQLVGSPIFVLGLLATLISTLFAMVVTNIINANNGSLFPQATEPESNPSPPALPSISIQPAPSQPPSQPPSSGGIILGSFLTPSQTVIGTDSNNMPSPNDNEGQVDMNPQDPAGNPADINMGDQSPADPPDPADGPANMNMGDLNPPDPQDPADDSDGMDPQDPSEQMEPDAMDMEDSEDNSCITAEAYILSMNCENFCKNIPGSTKYRTTSLDDASTKTPACACVTDCYSSNLLDFQLIPITDVATTLDTANNKIDEESCIVKNENKVCKEIDGMMGALFVEATQLECANFCESLPEFNGYGMYHKDGKSCRCKKVCTSMDDSEQSSTILKILSSCRESML